MHSGRASELFLVKRPALEFPFFSVLNPTAVLLIIFFFIWETHFSDIRNPSGPFVSALNEHYIWQLDNKQIELDQFLTWATVLQLVPHELISAVVQSLTEVSKGFWGCYKN